ncbi:MAG: cation-translocating P-type ATPase [Eubacteriales bacterium]
MNKNYHMQSVEKVLSDLNTQIMGLSKQEAAKRLEENGPNLLPEGDKKTVFGIFLQQFKNVMIWVLIAAASISLAMGEVTDAVIIFIVVLLNSVMGTIQEARAEAALESLKSLAAPKSTVVRDGSVMTIDSANLVVGDMVLLEAGMSVSADIRVTDSATLSAVESALTGESEAVIKITDAIADEHAVVGDKKNMAFMGTSISYGRGAGVVVGTGLDTEMGKIADKLATTEDEVTPLQKQIAQISKLISFGVIGIAVVIFAIGLLTGREAFDMFFLAVSLAVAAIPEGLATVVTIVLAMGMNRMSKQGAIIRKLPAVETLGSTNIICSDKTGTLTMNKMTVEYVYANLAREHDTSSHTPELIELVNCMAECNDANLDDNDNPIGDPTETALMDFALHCGLYTEEKLRSRSRIDEIPFESTRKLSSVLVGDAKPYTMYTKGAPDILIDRCSHILLNNKVVPLTDDIKKQILDTNTDMADNALRVLAFAKKMQDDKRISDKENAESNLTFLGLCAEMDPPRPEAAAAVAKCLKAGIRPIMITGDHRITASAIAKKLGMLDETKKAIEGREIEQLTDDELDNLVDDVCVYARVSPEHKVRIVDSWQRKGMIVAMTGDGVNDAPAIKSADIGVGMGITGTDVSKAASDMVLTDDNFATIVSAVEEGRKIFTNIKKAVKFLLSSNMGEVLALFIATMLGWQLFRPVHILWINLVTDTFPALALGVEPAEGDVMSDPPRDSRAPFFSKQMWFEILTHGAIEGGIALGVYIYAFNAFDSIVATTMAFITLGLTQLFHALGSRFDVKSFLSAPFSNKSMILAFLVSGILQVMVVLIPPIRVAFSLALLTGPQWLIAAAASVLMLIYMEIEKAIKRARSK